MSSLVIVALPSSDDYVWRISSEKVPHMTLLYLGEMDPGPDMASIENFLSHLVSTSMHRFGMSVDHRGKLGPDDADVLFFSKEHTKMIQSARIDMLANPLIRKAYNSVDQFPEWTPHLTLGYPATPAKPDNRDYPGIGWINFDRIALWTGDFDGPEFRLEDREEAALAMTDYTSSILEHHGIKGMKWGVRKAERNSPDVTISTNPQKNKRVKVTGGKGHSIHEDAAQALVSKQKAKTSGTHTLSNKELEQLVKRMNLEQQLKRLNHPNKPETQKFIEEQLKSVGRQKLQKLAAK